MRAQGINHRTGGSGNKKMHSDYFRVDKINH